MKLSSFLHLAAFGVKTILFRKKSPILGTVIVTDKCNLHCKHCSVNNITAVVHPYEQIRQEMKRLYDTGVRILFFCGGETFLWKDGERTLRDLVIEAKSMGFLIVNAVTNGTFPIDLPEADLILLSLDGDKQRHNEVRGDTYDTIMKNISNATADNICFYMAINQINKDYRIPPYTALSPIGSHVPMGLNSIQTLFFSSIMIPFNSSSLKASIL